MDAVTTPSLATAKRIVIKIGSALVIEGSAPAHAWLASVAEDVAALRARGVEALIVSSGAVALGRGALKLTAAKLTLAQKQACAAAGQARLMRAYEEAFAAHGMVVAQALVTPDDTERRRRWLNARATLETLLELGAAPILNENDTVATQELRYGDNDRLAARVAQMVSADALLLLSDVDGLYTADPRVDPTAAHVPLVRAVTPEIEAMAGGANADAGVGSGGMRTKVEAAKIAMMAGCATAIMRGGAANPLARLEAGERATWFTPAATPKQAYKAWIAGALSPRGALLVDDGAAAALRAGKSLLVAGLRGVEGRFEKGDAVRIRTMTGADVGRGLARYDADDASRIQGLKSDQIAAALGYTAGPILVHADDLALT